MLCTSSVYSDQKKMWFKFRMKKEPTFETHRVFRFLLPVVHGGLLYTSSSFLAVFRNNNNQNQSKSTVLQFIHVNMSYSFLYSKLNNCTGKCKYEWNCKRHYIQETLKAVFTHISYMLCAPDVHAPILNVA